jgi:hypothetical protein
MQRFVAALMICVSCLVMGGHHHAPSHDDMPEATHSFVSAVNPNAMWED